MAVSSLPRDILFHVAYTDQRVLIWNRKRIECLAWSEELSNIQNSSSKSDVSAVPLAAFSRLDIGKQLNERVVEGLDEFGRKNVLNRRSCQSLELSRFPFLLPNSFHLSDGLLFGLFSLSPSSWSSSLDANLAAVFAALQNDLRRYLVENEIAKDHDIHIENMEMRDFFRYQRNYALFIKTQNRKAALSLQKIISSHVDRIEAVLKEQIITLWPNYNKLNDFEQSSIQSIKFGLDKLRTLGGLILDSIDPSRSFPKCDTDHWIPSLIRVESERVKFVSEISGVYDTGVMSSLNMIEDFETILSKMISLFRQISVDLSLANTGVIVKSQCYVLEEGDEYEGQLHREGLEDESIVAVGLYYPLVSDTLHGGELQITAVLKGGCGSKYPSSSPVVIRQGTAVVFNNQQVYHRLQLMKGIGRRVVIGFFIVQSSKFPFSNQIEVNMDYKAELALLVLEQIYGVNLPVECRKKIMEYVRIEGQVRYKKFQMKHLKPTTERGLSRSTMD
jgi:hypothetical protein